MTRAPTILIVGASRGLGYGLAVEFLQRDWNVIGTVRAGSRTALHDLADANPGRVEIATLDIADADQIAALRDRLAGRTLDMLFVNAGMTTRDPLALIGAVSVEEFAAVMTTNAFGPARVIDALQALVPANGLIGAMSSGQGSITNNEAGLREAYRASKAALNMLMRSFAARERDRPRAMALIAPGWIGTDLGGAGAPYTIEDTVPVIADILLAKRARPGLEYLDRFGQTVPW